MRPLLAPLALFLLVSVARADDPASVVLALRAVHAAQISFRQSHPQQGFACTLEQLGPSRNAAGQPTGGVGWIGAGLAAGRVGGYRVQMNCVNRDYQAVAVRTEGENGPAFCVDGTGRLRTSRNAAACIARGRAVPAGWRKPAAPERARRAEAFR